MNLNLSCLRQKSRSPSPDSSSPPDTRRKSSLLSTACPQVDIKTLTKEHIQNKKDEYIKILKRQNQQLREQNIKIKEEIKNKDKPDLNRKFRSHNPSEKQIFFDDLNEPNKDLVLSEFNKLMRQTKEQTHSKIQKIQSRLGFVQGSYKKLYELLHQVNTIRASKDRKNKHNRNNGYIRDTTMADPVGQYSILINEESIAHNETMKSLEEELTTIRKQNKQLTSQLKQVYMKESKKQIGHDKYERQIRLLKETIEDLRFQLNDKQEQNYVSMKQFKGFKFQPGDGQATNQRLQELVEELEKQKISKNKSERALELVLHNYNISQQNLNFIQQQNQKLKVINFKMQKQLQQYISGNKPTQLSQQKNTTPSFSPSPSPSPKTSKSPPSSFDPTNQQLLKTRLQHVQYQNQGLHFLRKRYQSENKTFLEDMKILEDAVCRYWDVVVRQSGAKMVKGGRQMEIIQRIIQSILERLTLMREQLKGCYVDQKEQQKLKFI